MPNGTDVQQDEVEVARMLRETFGSSAGQQTLTWLLMELGWGSRAESPEDVTRYNFAVHLLDCMGITQLPNMPRMTEDMLKLPDLIEED